MAEPVRRPTDPELAALMRASRVISAVVARSIADTDDAITMPQLRTLVLVASRPNVNASAVAAALNVHLSNASRLCDRLVNAGWLHRQDSPADRRNLILTLTEEGSALVASIMTRRMTAFAEILDRLDAVDRAALHQCLNTFADAANEPAELDYVI